MSVPYNEASIPGRHTLTYRVRDYARRFPVRQVEVLATPEEIQTFVRDGYLVAQLPPETTLRLAGDANPYRGLAIKTQQGLLVGNLSRGQDSTWRIRDGLVAGRIRSADLVATFREVGLCEGDSLDAFYGSLVEYAKDNADVLADGSTDASRA